MTTTLRRFGLSFWISLLVLILLMIRPVLSPQFTINSGLLVLSAFICIHLYAKDKQLIYLLLASLLGLLSYWVRGVEFLFVSFIALPLLPWRSLLSRTPITILAVFCILIMASTIIDRQSYQTEKWKNFNELNPVRAHFTDFGAAKRLLNQPEVLKKYGYSHNDIALIASWFFVDPTIASPLTLQKMIDSLEPIPIEKKSLRNALSGLYKLASFTVIALTLTSLFLFFLNPSWKLATAWGLFIITVFIIGLLGRPGIIRIYIPILSLLVIAPLLIQQLKIKNKKYIISFLFIATIYNVSYTIYHSNKDHSKAREIRQTLHSFTKSPVAIWGSSFPFESVYPALKISSSAMDYQLYSMGVFTQAPYSISYKEQQFGHGFVTLFTGDTGIYIIANKQQVKLLKIYCSEHFKGTFHVDKSLKYKVFNLSKYRCSPYSVVPQNSL